MKTALNIAKALADGNRMRVIAALLERDELCVCQITEMLGLAGATVSRHMSILQNADLVRSRKDGRWVYYRLAHQFPDLLRQWLAESFLDSPKIRADRKSLKSILSCEPDDLCRQQKERKGEELISNKEKNMNEPGDLPEKQNAMKILRIYDPAMCCSSGVCGPSVDPLLAQFAGTLQFIGKQDGVAVERYNLGQEPQAFVANEQVKALLAAGGDKRLPFIFIDDELVFTARYPSRNELLQALGIVAGNEASLGMAPPAAGPCCGEGGCC